MPLLVVEKLKQTMPLARDVKGLVKIVPNDLEMKGPHTRAVSRQFVSQNLWKIARHWAGKLKGY